jgi:ATP-dependent DNA ligase
LGSGLTGCHGSRSYTRQTAAHAAILYVFDPIEHHGEDLRGRPLLERKAVLARLLRDATAGIRLNEHIGRG